MRKRKKSGRRIGLNAKSNKKLYSAMKFLVKFNLLAIPLYIVIIFDFQLTFLKETTAAFTLVLLHATGINAVVNDFFISIPLSNGLWGAYINWDCTGWKSMYAMFALIFSTEFPLRKKLLGLIFLPAIFLVNIIRIWFMFFYVSNYGLANYEIIHSVIWSWGLIITVLVFWVAWMRIGFGSGKKYALSLPKLFQKYCKRAVYILLSTG